MRSKIIIVFVGILFVNVSFGAATVYWDWGGGDNRWETPNNWGNNQLPTLEDTIRPYVETNYGATAPPVHITIDTTGVAKTGRVQYRESVNSITILPGADFETRGSIEIYQDWGWNLHEFTVHGTAKTNTRVGYLPADWAQLRIGGHQSYSTNVVTVSGTLNVCSYDVQNTGRSEIWIGYARNDDTASYDHNMLYIHPTGTVKTDYLFIKTGNYFIFDISKGGKFIEKGNNKTKLDGYVSASTPSQFSGDGLAGNVTVTYNAAADETVIEAGTSFRIVQFVAGTPKGWNYYALGGDLNSDSFVDCNDLAVVANQWLNNGCGSPGWCDGADIDQTGSVDFADFAFFAKDWPQVSAEKVLFQTIYGTAQDAGGQITANNTYTLLKSKTTADTNGLAMAFSVPAGKVLDKAIFKCADSFWGTNYSRRLLGFIFRMRIRLYNVTGQGYLNYGKIIGKAAPGGVSNNPIFDITVATPNPTPYHLELSDGRKYTDMVINFGPDDIASPGEYLLVFDPVGKLYSYDEPQTPWGGMIRGTAAEADAMGKYADGTNLPKRATVTTSGATGNTYYYQLNTTSDANYTPCGNLLSCQFLTK